MRIAPAIVFSLAASVAQAQDFFMFHSPSGNIHCAIFTGDYSGARCDVMDVSAMSYPNPPADCDLDWGHAFEVGATGPGTPSCVGDTVADPSGFVLDYGKSFSAGGFTCTSARSGMTCVNGQGHGFSVRKAGQKVF